MFDLLSPLHIAVLLVVVLLIFGPKRLPDLGKSLGQTLRMFKQASTSMTDESGEPPSPPHQPGELESTQSQNHAAHR